MGEPTQPTEAERAATLELARSIVEAVRNDVEDRSECTRVVAVLHENARRARANGMLFVADDMERSANALDLETFRLAQDLTIATAERDEALKQSRLGWERAAENDRAYAGALRERDVARKLAGHDESVRCVACLGPLVPCDCQPNCPGGRCVECGRRDAIGPVWNGKPITKTDQIRLCGNICPPQWAEEMIAANFGEAL